MTKGAGSREAGLAMAFKLLDAASERWRKVNAPHLVALVRAGARFIDGQLLERSEPRPTEPITDGLTSYPAAVLADYTHEPVNVTASGLPAHISLPGVHRVASLAKRWLLGTHQGAIEADHLQAYLDEFAFRFNRRKAEARGMLFYRLLEQAVASDPLPYTQIVVSGRPKRTRPTAPTSRRVPASLTLEAPARLWRTASV